MGGFGQGDGWEGAWVTSLRDDGLRDSGGNRKKPAMSAGQEERGLQSTILRRESAERPTGSHAP
jgi:hypothetical protein